MQTLLDKHFETPARRDANALQELGHDLFNRVQWFRYEPILKTVNRQVRTAPGGRPENAAEHTWGATLLAMLLAPTLDEPLDLSHVLQMLILHDLVEVEAGDVGLFDVEGRRFARDREEKAARKIFGALQTSHDTALHDRVDSATLNLPETGRELPDGYRFWALWTEFEHGTSLEARFARVVDRLHPLWMMYVSGQYSDRSFDMLIERYTHIREDFIHLWPSAVHMLRAIAADAGAV